MYLNYFPSSIQQVKISPFDIVVTYFEKETRFVSRVCTTEIITILASGISIKYTQTHKVKNGLKITTNPKGSNMLMPLTINLMVF